MAPKPASFILVKKNSSGAVNTIWIGWTCTLASDFSPIIANNRSNGPRFAPAAFWTARRPWARSKGASRKM
jgi:hypothetical protein